MWVYLDGIKAYCTGRGTSLNWNPAYVESLDVRKG